MKFFEKLYLKSTNKPLYKRIKRDLRFLDKASAAGQINLHPDKSASFSFKHSGNAGDIIYSLPTVYALSEGAPASLFLHLDQPSKYEMIRGSHPLKNVMLNQKMFSMLHPLLVSQPEIKQCTVYNGEKIDYDLDVFRDSSIMLDRGNIARWYFLYFAVSADLSKPWLQVQPDNSFSDHIVIARSSGYHSPGINYSFLQKYKKLAFVGIKEEFEDMRKMIPSLEYHQVSDFLELAKAIAGCKFFIGNQSFPFSIAEALKVKRILEVCYECPNVVVEGASGYDFCFQPQFEKIVDKLYHQS